MAQETCSPMRLVGITICAFLGPGFLREGMGSRVWDSRIFGLPCAGFSAQG